jgi:hypothetical protein
VEAGAGSLLEQAKIARDKKERAKNFFMDRVLSLDTSS